MLGLVSAVLERLTVMRNDEEGATAVEYGLMVALIAAIIIGVVQALGVDVLNAFQTIVDGL